MIKRTFCPPFSKGWNGTKHYGDLPPWSYIQLSGRDNLKFYIEGRFVGHYDRHRKLRRIVFLFRDIEEEVCRRFILDMAMAQTKIFPWFFDLTTAEWSSTPAGSTTSASRAATVR